MTAYVDTLVIEVVYGLPTEAPAFSSTYYPRTPDTLWCSPPKIYGDTAQFGFKSRLSDPNKIVIKHILTDQDSTFGSGKTIKGPLGLYVPGNNVVGVSYTFVPGYPYSLNDTLHSYVDPQNQSLNSFRVGLYSQGNTASYPDFFYDPYGFYNLSYYIRKNGRYGLYSSSFQNETMRPRLYWGFDIGFYVTENTGISENTEANIKIYPNPTNEYLNIELSDNKKSQISVYNILGKLVYSEKLNGVKNTIDISKLSSATYVLKISQENAIITKKLIVK